MANEIRVEIGEESSLAAVLNRVIPPVLKLPVDLGHVTEMAAAGRDWLFRPHLVRSGFCPRELCLAPLYSPAHRGWC